MFSRLLNCIIILLSVSVLYYLIPDPIFRNYLEYKKIIILILSLVSVIIYLLTDIYRIDRKKNMLDNKLSSAEEKYSRLLNNDIDSLNKKIMFLENKIRFNEEQLFEKYSIKLEEYKNLYSNKNTYFSEKDDLPF